MRVKKRIRWPHFKTIKAMFTRLQSPPIIFYRLTRILRWEFVMEFCPSCDTLLKFRKGVKVNQYFCPACSYVRDVPLNHVPPKDTRIKKQTIFLKEEDADLANKTLLPCKICHSKSAIRLGVEESGAFREYRSFVIYRCTACGAIWRSEPWYFHFPFKMIWTSR